MYSVMASSCSSVRSLSGLLCSTLCSRGTSRVRHRKYTPGCSRRTCAMAFSPCLRKSRKSAQMTSSLNALREPRGRPAGLPETPRRQRLLGMFAFASCCCFATYDSVGDSAIWTNRREQPDGAHAQRRNRQGRRLFSWPFWKRRRAPNRIFLPNSSLAGSRLGSPGTELCIFADTVVTYGLRYGYGLGGPLC